MASGWGEDEELGDVQPPQQEEGADGGVGGAGRRTWAKFLLFTLSFICLFLYLFFLCLSFPFLFFLYLPFSFFSSFIYSSFICFFIWSFFICLFYLPFSFSFLFSVCLFLFAWARWLTRMLMSRRAKWLTSPLWSARPRKEGFLLLKDSSE